MAANSFGQHHSKLVVELIDEQKTLNVRQELTFVNESDDIIPVIVLNDWNHAYSSKSTPLARRFSDEFVRSFHLANESERGQTNNLTIIDRNDNFLTWNRPERTPDLVEVTLREPLLPGRAVKLHLTYSVKLPSDRFTRYGFKQDGGYYLKNWFLTPARYDNHRFLRYSNLNIDDIANAQSDYDVEIKVGPKVHVISDLDIAQTYREATIAKHHFTGKNRKDFHLFIEPLKSFHSYKNEVVEVANGLRSDKVTEIQQALIIDRITKYVQSNVGDYPYRKITVAQADYDRNPFYGLNQLPSFISPFSDEFLYEIKFLKTYLNNFLKTSMQLDARKDNWIFDGIQVYMMMKYIEEFHPDSKMMGVVANWRLLKGFNLVNLDFNEQYSYFYMLMARKNLDQPIGAPKDRLIKFNEQIAGKYRSGLSFRYLDSYLGDNTVNDAINRFYTRSVSQKSDRSDFEFLLQSETPKNIDWFFNTIIDSRQLIDYKFDEVTVASDSVKFTINNRTGIPVPMPVYGIKDDQIVFKEWLDVSQDDSITSVARRNAEKIVLNYENQVPEYNLRNNWRSLSGSITNRPIKFTFMKDLEDPYYNQILYVPTFMYNLYDGLSLGLRFHNKTILDKPITFDVNPMYSSNQKMLIGNFGVSFNQNLRDGALYNIRYGVGGSYFHYAPDAAYTKLTPSLTFRFREPNFRDNRKQTIMLREVIVHRDPTIFDVGNNEETVNYSVFNARYFNTRTEVVHHVNFMADLQIAGKFGKAASEIEFRQLFEDNRQLSLRMYAGAFLYNKTEGDFFSFALDRPTDYLFDYNYYGRSEGSGLFSQQLILSEGGFKSKLNVPYANQWITTVNAGYSIWNWIEVYGDAGFLKNKGHQAEFLYDSGIRLNLVPDYLELYFPVYSSNGWEIGQPNYEQRIRFIVALDPKTLINLFTRKWF
ncbi:MAG: aminopeptidase [Flavobacterium sp.]|nr:aminopeptidase [Flavobacterium sp.]